MKYIDDDYFKSTTSTKNDINDYLIEDERILWKGTPKRKATIAEASVKMAPFAIVWMLFDSCFLASVITMFVEGNFPVAAFVGIIIFFALHLTPVWIWFAMIISAAKKASVIRYFITNVRVIEYNRKYNIILHDVKLSDMVDVSLYRSKTDIINRVGDIIVRSETSVIKILDQPEYNMLVNKLSKITNDNNFDEVNYFIGKSLECPYCSSSLDKNTKKCPYCGGNI